MRAFERYVDGDEREQKKVETRDGEILYWTPRRPVLSVQYCRSFVSGFFKCQKRGQNDGAWQCNQFLSPFFDRCRLCKLERDIAATAEEASKILPVRRKWPNVSSAERSDTKDRKIIMDQLCIPGNYFGSNAVYTFKMHAKGLITMSWTKRRKISSTEIYSSYEPSWAQIQGARKLLGVYLQLYYQGCNKRCQEGNAMQFLYYMEAAQGTECM